MGPLQVLCHGPLGVRLQGPVGEVDRVRTAGSQEPVRVGVDRTLHMLPGVALARDSIPVAQLCLHPLLRVARWTCWVGRQRESQVQRELCHCQQLN